MNDDHDADATPEPEQDAHIRALLAELGAGPDGEPMPPEVAARLEDTLALLVAERGRAGAAANTGNDESDSPGKVVPIRRRWQPRLAGAAAAVVVLGAGGVAVANFGLLGGSSSSADRAGAGDSTTAGSSPEATATSPAPGGDPLGRREASIAGASLPAISATSFASDVKALLQRRASLVPPAEKLSAPDASAGAAPESSPGPTSSDQAKRAPAGAQFHKSCPGPEITDGAFPDPVRYDGDPAVLVVHPEHDGHRLVEAWDCAGDRRLASTTLTP
jgi:hypothetical protein